MSHLKIAFAALLLCVTGCDLIPFALPPSTPGVLPSTLVYDAPVNLNVKAGKFAPGTTIAYGGKTPTGAARSPFPDWLRQNRLVTL